MNDGVLPVTPGPVPGGPAVGAAAGGPGVARRSGRFEAVYRPATVWLADVFERSALTPIREGPLPPRRRHDAGR